MLRGWRYYGDAQAATASSLTTRRLKHLLTLKKRPLRAELLKYGLRWKKNDGVPQLAQKVRGRVSCAPVATLEQDAHGCCRARERVYVHE